MSKPHSISRLTLAYDGSPFAGWAVQPGERTVEGELRAALGTVLRAPVALIVAGRTDRGVRATGMVLVDRPLHWAPPGAIDWVAAAETAEPGRWVGGASAGW